MANTSPVSKIAILKDRAAMLSAARLFFAQRNILEVDCPAITAGAPIDLHIDILHVPSGGYLFSSPEYGMKRLLSLGLGDIYQLCHVYREGECGPLHNPEFTMAEWYRMQISFDAFIEETLEFLCLFLGNLPKSSITYREALKKYAGIDYLDATVEMLLACAKEHRIDLSASKSAWDKDTLLQLLMGFVVEPHLGKEGLCTLRDYPASQAALAQTCYRGTESVAERFEIYYKGIELANGYHELTDAKEQRRRLEKAQAERAAGNKSYLPIDERFLTALEHGLPDCCGVAVGFDRLLMLRHGATALSSVLPIAWEER